ncbi:MAG: heme o synthase [Rickettsiaceae bacterium]|nr:heme o synthase [Rickettsiaceae bacterium]
MGLEFTNLSVPETESSDVTDYVNLMKPRVMSLVVFSSIVGIVMAPGHIHPFLAFVSILCVMTGHGAAASLNMWYDRDIDAIMKRTRQRPTVTGKILPEDALSFGIILGFFSVLIMTVCINYVAGALLLVTILFYFFIYTIWLKRRSIQNIVIGGAAGAIPPMIGWASVTGGISFESILLFLLIFMWTPPHFWSLAIYKSEDYRICNIPMMPIVKGYDYTKRQIVAYTIVTVITSLIPSYIGMSGNFYFIVSSLMGLIFISLSILMIWDKKNAIAPKMFIFSIIYLFGIFLAMITDHIFHG